MDGNVTNKLIMLLAAGALAAVLVASNTAQGQIALQRRLAAATSVECRFTTLATGNWDGGTPSAKVTETELETSFFDINVDEGTAEADSPFGASLIIVRYAEGYLHLMQMAYAGPLHVTTILARETKDGRLMAVHTRHEYTPTSLPGFTSRPEMYIGDCAITN
jgi:hypothetical protein